MECRSLFNTAKERVIRHTLASNFARKVEQRIMSNNGKNMFRDKLWNHSTYLPSHGIINEEHDYEMFVRFADGSKDCKISKDYNNWQVNDIDENLLSQGFVEDTWSNYVLKSNYFGEEVSDLYLWMDLNFRDLELFTEDPNSICSYKEKRVFNPAFDNFLARIRNMLTTVVAVHKQTRKVYLVSTTWGFDKEEGWVEANVYGICGTYLKTERGSKETSYLSICLDTDEDNKGYEEEYLPQIRLRIDYYCPTTEYRYLRFEPIMVQGFGRKKSHVEYT